jgi:hypothetical protein
MAAFVKPRSKMDAWLTITYLVVYSKGLQGFLESGVDELEGGSGRGRTDGAGLEFYLSADLGT